MGATLLQVRDARKSYGTKVLFEGASFAVNEGEHVGVIGPNGAGKTTLFRALVGDEELDSGEIVRSQGLRLGYLAQHDHFAPDETVEDYLVKGAHMPIWELKSLARGLGLSHEMFSRPMLSFSGGYRMRVKLLRLLGQEPNLMLLDEPTNYLDLETMLVLEGFLANSKSAFLLISHDREFLRLTTDHILEVEAGDMTKFPGSIDDYFEEKAMLRAQLEARALSAEAKRREVLDFVARFGAKASKARQAQSRLKSLDRMEKVEVKALPVAAKIRIPAPKRVGKLVLEVEAGEAGFPERSVLRNLNLQIEGGDRVGVVGLNGAGKTTLLRSLAGDLPLRSGKIERGYEIDLAYYGQHVTERLNPAHTVFDALLSVTDHETTPQDVLDMAGSLLFPGDDVRKKVSVLSGGEKSRVALGQVLLRKASCLLLDEPTNHLDFHTVEALTQALQGYPGTVIVVSHDRSFVGRVATKILEVRDGGAWLYPGSYDDYVWSLSKRVRAAVEEPAAASSAPAPKPDKKLQREERQKAEARLRFIRKRGGELERSLADLQKKMDALNAELLHAKGPEAQRIAADLGATQKSIDENEQEWLALMDEEASLGA